MIQWAGFIPVFFVIIGILRRHTRRFHAFCMSAAFTIDLSLLLYVEFSRHAIDKFLFSESNRLLLNIHVGFSTAVLGLYVLMIATGIYQWRRSLIFRRWRLSRAFWMHRRGWVLFAACRIGSLVTSFWV